MKRFFFGIAILIQLVIVVVIINILVVNDKETICYSGKDFSYQQNINGENMWHSKTVGLGKGSYTLNLTYTYEGADGDIFLSDNLKACDNIHKSSQILLYEGAHKVETTYWVSSSVNDFSLLIVGEEGSTLDIYEMTIMENSNLGLVCVTLFVLASACIDFIILRWRNIKKTLVEKDNKWMVPIIVCAIASIPLSLNYLLWAPHQDLQFHLLRIEGIYEALLAGQFPARMNSSFIGGYGYPTGILYPEFFLYIPAFLRLLGFPLMTAYKIFVFFLNFLTAAIAGCAGKIIFKEQKYSNLFCVLYVLAPYRLVCLYIRGALAETIAMTFFPLLIVVAMLLMKEQKDYKKIYFLFVISICGIMQSHLLSCTMILIFGILLIGLSWKSFIGIKNVICVLSAVITSVLLNMWFLVPFLSASKLDLKAFSQTNEDIYIHSLTVFQLFLLSPKASGKSAALSQSIAEDMPLFPGIVVMLGFFGFIVMCASKKYVKNQEFHFTKKMWILGSLSLIMSTVLFPWYALKHVPKLGKVLCMVQFPWRYLGLATLFLLVVAVFCVKMYEDKEIKGKIIATLCVMSVILSLALFQSASEEFSFLQAYDSGGLNVYELIGQEYLYNGTDVQDLKTHESETVCGNEQNGNVVCNINSKQENNVYRLPLLYYPWYVAKDVTTGEKIDIVKGENNVAFLELPEGYSGAVKVSFEEPMAWKVGNVISLVTLISLMVCVYIDRRKKAQSCGGKAD